MKKDYLWFLVVSIIFLLFFQSVIAIAKTNLSGKDFVRLGKMGTLTGNLMEDNEEWYLKTQNGTIHDLHFGNHDHRAKTGIKLKVGKQATVTGFIYEDNLTVCTINIDGQTYRFREDDGTPLWAGGGVSSQNSK